MSDHALTLLADADLLEMLWHDAGPDETGPLVIAKHMRDAAAEITRLRERTEWRFDLENAPKRGEALLYFPKDVGKTKLPAMMTVGRVDEYPFRKPTHYLPLPPPPGDKP